MTLYNHPGYYEDKTLGCLNKPGLAVASPVADYNRVFSSVNDTNGIIYFFGTNFGTTAWTNPHTAGLVSTYLANTNTTQLQAALCDRTYVKDFNIAPVYVNDLPVGGRSEIDLKTYKVNITDFVYGASSPSAMADVLPRNFQIYGYNDTYSNRTIIASYTNDTTITSGNNRFRFALSSNTYFRYIGMQTTPNGNQNGDYYMRISDMEIYGNLIAI